MKKNFLDINDFNSINKKIKLIKPNIIFHLAAQPFVLESFNNPIETLKQILLAANIVRSALLNKIKHNLIITTDKCYKNNKNLSFNENSELRGKDPYSASKACAEIITKSLADSFSQPKFILIL